MSVLHLRVEHPAQQRNTEGRSTSEAKPDVAQFLSSPGLFYVRGAWKPSICASRTSSKLDVLGELHTGRWSFTRTGTMRGGGRGPWRELREFRV